VQTSLKVSVNFFKLKTSLKLTVNFHVKRPAHALFPRYDPGSTRLVTLLMKHISKICGRMVRTSDSQPEGREFESRRGICEQDTLNSTARVAIISRIAWGTPNLSTKKKKEGFLKHISMQALSK
jgi:hypothetical protein